MANRVTASIPSTFVVQAIKRKLSFSDTSLGVRSKVMGIKWQGHYLLILLHNLLPPIIALFKRHLYLLKECICIPFTYHHLVALAVPHEPRRMVPQMGLQYEPHFPVYVEC